MFVALSTLLLEISLTRIFSVTVSYHFAFLIISLTMFGMTAGAVIVFLDPNLLGSGSAQSTRGRLAYCALFFSISIMLSLLVHITTPIILSQSFINSLPGLFAVAWSCLVISMPFVFSGIFVCAVLSQFVQRVHSLYAIDMLGASLGCPLVVFVLNASDGPTTVTMSALLASLAAAFLAWNSPPSRILKCLISIWLVCLGSLFWFNLQAINANKQPPLRLVWVRGAEDIPSYNRWNSFSRIRIFGDPQAKEPPFGWSLSPSNPFNQPVRQMHLDIDSCAGSVLTGKAGSTLDYLKYDICNMAHYLKSNANVLVIGVGGGRDILSALTFGQKAVLALELNNHILEALNGNFGDYTGHLDRNPRVKFVNDEARSYITRSDDTFDIIQISLIDTWAATASGAFAIAENSLYTIEAFRTFLNHLSGNGILSVSRWYFFDGPAETYRLVALATASLRQIGIEDPRKNLVLLKSPVPSQVIKSKGTVATLLVSKDGFSSKEMAIIADKAKQLQFEILLSPSTAADPRLYEIVTTKNWRQIEADFNFRIDPPTDDCPYFFQFIKPQDIFNVQYWKYNVSWFVVLLILFMVLLLMLSTCVFMPLILKGHTLCVKANSPLYLYFAFIGMGFILMEMSLMQRLNVFLGHPSYGLSVVLFSLLLSSGAGSIITGLLDRKKKCQFPSLRLLALFSCFLIVGSLMPRILEHYQGEETSIRILVAAALIPPLGLLAGTAMPTGFTLAAQKGRDVRAWLWAVNGGASVLASSIAVLISVNFGTSVSFWLAGAFYLAAALVIFKQSSMTNPALKR